MSTSKANIPSVITRELICATCLSQDRKLFPVNELKPLAIIGYHLTLLEGAKLCWECKYFVQKVTAFRNQAMKAQKLLVKISGKVQKRVTSLSNLTVSTGHSIDILAASDSDLDNEYIEDTNNLQDPLFSEVKLEPGFIDSIKEETLDIEFHQSPEKSSDDDDDDEAQNISDEDKMKTFVIRRKIKSDEGKGGEGKGMNDDNIANVTLRSLLDKKLAALRMPKLPENRLTKPYTRTVKFEEKTDKSPEASKVTKPGKIPKASEVVELIEVSKAKEAETFPKPEVFTEVKMTEEEMLKWRERKKEMPYYTNSIPVYRCTLCIVGFEERKSFLAHQKRHENAYGEFACRICGLRSVTEVALLAHTATHYSLLKCRYCSFEWDDPNAVREHCSDIHGVRVSVWNCEFCPKMFPSRRKIVHHLRCHRVSPCPECGKLMSLSSLTEHMKRHEGLPIRKCEVCGGMYKGDHGLKLHMKKHEGKIDEDAFCAECQIQFKDKYQYRSHIRNTLKHAGDKQLPLKCDHCGKGFLTKASLRIHLVHRHSTAKPHACATCGLAFKTTAMLRRHERWKHEGKGLARDKVCDHCGKAFTSLAILAGHLNSHTGARPFHCKLCGATFGYKSALYTHGRLKHKIKKKNQQDEVK